MTTAQLDDIDRQILHLLQRDARMTNAAIAAEVGLTGPSVFDFIPDQPYTDFGFDVLPRLAGRMFGYPIAEYFCDIGTPERLDRARREWAAIPAQRR